MLHIPIFETHLEKVFIKLVLDYQILLVLLILVMSYMFTLHIENINVHYAWWHHHYITWMKRLKMVECRCSIRCENIVNY